MREVLVNNEEFKDSPVGKIPKYWEVKTLRELSVGGISNGFFKKPELVGSGYPLVNVFDLYQDFGIDLSLVERVNASEKEQSKYAIQPGDCFFTRSSLVLSGIAHCNIIRNLREAALFECHLMRVRPDKSQVIPEFLALWCRSSLARKFLMSRAKQVTMTTISQPDIAPLPVPLPPKEEQQRIAEILDTVDEAIARTSSLIIKLKQTKAGLLQDLLTRGLDEDGKLRDPQAHPEQFKDSALGRIPKDWEFTTLGTVVFRDGGIIQTGPFGSQLHAYEYVNVGVPVIMPQDIEDGYISNHQIVSISPTKANSLARHRVKLNDVVFARRGNLERCAFIDKREVDWLCGTGCLLVRPPELEINARWLAAIYQHHHSQQQILARAVGSTMVNLNSTLLADLIIARPDYKEQIAIVEIIDTHNTRIRQEQAYLKKLKLQKQGLMQDLLTGKVRVKNL